MTDTLQLGHVQLADVLSGETNLRSDGTLWSHAATLGTFVYGDLGTVTFDAELLRTVVANFQTGYPAKVPVDYEHDTQKAAKDRAQAPVMAAGRIVEVKAVLTLDDLLPDMKKQLDEERAERQKIGMSRDVDPLGLWIRWQPTARALSMVKAKECNDMSVVIAFDYPHKNTGEGQGPTLLSVALTNTPFLDDMIPVAASRGGARPDSPAATPPQETTNMATKLMLAVAALTGKQAADEDIAVAHINERFATLTANAQIGEKHSKDLALLTSAIGVTDPAQAVVKINEIKTKAEKAEQDAAAALLSATKGAVETFLKAQEKRIPSVPAKEYFAASLTAEMLKEPTKKIEEQPTAKIVLTLSETMTGRLTPTDNGSNVNDSPDVILAARTKEIMNSDEEIKSVTKAKGYATGYMLASSKAAKELGITDIRAPQLAG